MADEDHASCGSLAGQIVLVVVVVILLYAVGNLIHRVKVIESEMGITEQVLEEQM